MTTIYLMLYIKALDQLVSDLEINDDVRCKQRLNIQGLSNQGLDAELRYIHLIQMIQIHWFDWAVLLLLGKYLWSWSEVIPAFFCEKKSGRLVISRPADLTANLSSNPNPIINRTQSSKLIFFRVGFFFVAIFMVNSSLCGFFRSCWAN